MKFKENLPAKIASVIFSYVMAIILVISVVGIGVMGYFKFYFSNPATLKEEILTDMAQSEAYHIHNLLEWEEDLEDYYKDKNVYYNVVFYGSKDPITNYNGEEYIAHATSGHYIYNENVIQEEDGSEYTVYNEVKLGEIEVFIAKDMHKNDLFSVTASLIEIGYRLRYAIVFIALGSLAVFIYLICFLFCAAGHTKSGEVRCNYLDKMPFDLLTAIIAVLGILSIIVVENMAYDTISAIIWVAFIGSVDYFIALGYILSFATRVKTRTLARNNIVYYVLKFIWKYLRSFFSRLGFILKNVSLLHKTWIILSAIIAIKLIFMIYYVDSWYWYGPEPYVFATILELVIGVLVVLYFAIVLHKIKSGGERIAKGDLQHKIDTGFMFGDFKTFAEALNNINEGLSAAINEKMKSEHFKTELITNVTHDIKTPLTSIINYVDLIKKEDPQNPKVQEYIAVLDRQSGRLKKLVEDLLEASKASSGTLPVELTACDVGVLLMQAIGEFEQKLEAANIKLKLHIPKTTVKIMADGKHLWRVFDNLLSNICKYALGNTRAYINVEICDGRVTIVFKNISKNELDITADELMERFVRGDSSRNTEGSGLGLSIAKSLIELQNGEMFLSVDGDLFKAGMTFDIIE